ncbi:hypothetical protein FNH22_14220 [Fulvivirga sp. M361]|uniref:hypothetical protein n=1 Tax=Fulvivirga sp. M361 TaxID=2594266 RepID=UPI00117AF3B0|nr:hypothetical protein [Fulvivirga sp. M361]TRX58215.1 hypothetical protein FNH22_14220 [Fulvivirga sp. M361]
MFFSQRIITYTHKYLAVLLLLLSGCNDEEGSGIISQQDRDRRISLEILELVKGLNFSGVLPNGMAINFSPGGPFLGIGSNEYTSAPQGFSFSDQEQTTIDGLNFSKGNATLTINGQPRNYSFVTCFTLGELRRRFPDLFNFDPGFDNWLYFIAVSSNDYSVEQVVRGDNFRVDEILTIFVSPNRPIILSGDLTLKRGDRYYLDSRSAEYNDQKLTSEGRITENLSRNIIIGNYFLDLRCGN